MRRLLTLIALGAALTVSAVECSAQVRLDHTDPEIIERALPKQAPIAEPPIFPTLVVNRSARVDLNHFEPLVARAIVVNGNVAVPTTAFAPAIVEYMGRALSGDDLSKLAGAVASVARAHHYPFASASIPPQAMTDGILHVTLDEGRLSAVRVIGTHSPLADAILTKALVTGAPVKGEALESSILLVGDIPGLRVKESKYIRQDGFGILLVTVVEFRATAYIQIDNRGTAEIGPLRAALLASYRSLAQAGDEFGLITAVTPRNPSEFAFVRGRYSAPVGIHGATFTVSAAYGRANPGGTLNSLNVIGNSVDLAVAYTRPFSRSRARSLWGSIELRSLNTSQTLLGATLRHDRLVTLTGSVNGAATVAGGNLRGEVAIVEGLPLAGVTHEGDKFNSRADGDARFVTVGYNLDWTVGIGGPFSLAVASSGQFASRPLLASAELGIGGPTFGRAYDYADRTGDKGILGSAELRANLGKMSHFISRTQLYGFVDGGYVDNLRGGSGGGTLLSTGAGMRLSLGPFDGGIEVAVPINQNRLSIGSKRPRVSFRLSRSF